MKLRFNARQWHSWISLILAVPMFLVGITAVLLAHDKSLGLKDRPVSVGWLPGYSELAIRYEQQSVRALHVQADGALLLGTKQGVYRLESEQLQPLGANYQGEMRAFAEWQGQLFGAAKDGIWRYEPGGDQWQRQLKGDFHALTLNGGEVLASDKDGQGYRLDSRGWQADTPWQQGMAALPVQAVEQVTLGKLVKDIHTGKAFTGARYEWVFIDVVGFVLVFLSLTGVFLWWRNQRRQQQLQQPRPEPEPGKTGITEPVLTGTEQPLHDH